MAALRAEDGRIEWLSLYPRVTNGRRRPCGPNPCLFDGGTLFVAPADDPCVLAFNAADGRLLWRTGGEVEGGVELLGATDDYLIAGSGKLYWFGLHEKDRGQIMHVWPEGDERPGFGRGLSTKQNVLWPARNKLYILDRRTAKPLATIDLRMRGATGGNLLTADKKLLIATDSELIAIDTKGQKSEPSTGNK